MSADLSGEERIAKIPASILDAIEAVDADCRRLMFGADRDKPLATIYEILAQTPDIGTDVPEAIRAAMFGDGYLLSHERRLLAILVARALPEISRLRSALAEATEALKARDTISAFERMLDEEFNDRTCVCGHLESIHTVKGGCQDDSDESTLVSCSCEEFVAALSPEGTVEDSPHAGGGA